MGPYPAKFASSGRCRVTKLAPSEITPVRIASTHIKRLPRKKNVPSTQMSTNNLKRKGKRLRRKKKTVFQKVYELGKYDGVDL